LYRCRNCHAAYRAAPRACRRLRDSATPSKRPAQRSAVPARAAPIFSSSSLFLSLGEQPIGSFCQEQSKSKTSGTTARAWRAFVQEQGPWPGRKFHMAETAECRRSICGQRDEAFEPLALAITQKT
jgi:hypothetical protein